MWSVDAAPRLQRLALEENFFLGVAGQRTVDLITDACRRAPEATTFIAEVSPAFSALLASLLLSDPNERPASAGQVAAQLEAMR